FPLKYSRCARRNKSSAVWAVPSGSKPKSCRNDRTTDAAHTTRSKTHTPSRDHGSIHSVQTVVDTTATFTSHANPHATANPHHAPENQSCVSPGHSGVIHRAQRIRSPSFVLERAYPYSPLANC